MPYKDNAKPWAEFDELKGKIITDFSQVRVLIDELTDNIAGKKKNIINNPIKLSIYSSTCPDLTIIDLPGITRIPLFRFYLI